MSEEETIRLEKAIQEVLVELRAILDEIKQEKQKQEASLHIFFSEVRRTLFGGRLTSSQVEGMEAKIKAFKRAKWPVSWAAYGLATSYHETAKRMVPVREGLNASEEWRKRKLRYYPHYGRGDVQLTWEANYKRADEELGLDGKLVNNLDLALDPDISARIMVSGMEEGWFSKGQTLKKHLPNDVATVAQFTPARRIINIMDKASLIAGYAVKFQDALLKAEY